MRRVMILTAVLALVLGVAASHGALAGPAPKAKVKVCHLNGSTTPGSYTYEYFFDYDIGPDNGYHLELTYHVGREITVDASAVPTHLAHGDATTYFALDEPAADWIDNLSGIDATYFNDFGTYTYEWFYDGTSGDTGNGNCYFSTSESHFLP